MELGVRYRQSCTKELPEDFLSSGSRQVVLPRLDGLRHRVGSL